jgi:Mn2+/Fe2+ NRAMP family transporter
MIGIQIVSARIGRVTGHGLAANIREHFPRPLLYLIVSLLLIANTINIAADLGAMGDALALVVGGHSGIYIVFFALVSLTLQIFIPFPRYAPFLKWLTLALFAYVGTVLVVHVPLEEALEGSLLPILSFKSDYFAVLVAVLGTTISPYLFFWQASQEVEEQRAPGHEPQGSPDQARSHKAHQNRHVHRHDLFPTCRLCIMLTTAVTLHAAGVTDMAQLRRHYGLAGGLRSCSCGGIMALACSPFRYLRVLRLCGSGVLANRPVRH